MSIIQISKIQQRSGDLVDLPQLDQAELGFASDAGLLFIGKTSGEVENIEVLTAYSDISFSQIDGAYGNLAIDPSTIGNNQVLVYDSVSNAWTNRGGEAGGAINLGQVSNLTIYGGGIDYVLTTDGTGNLSWSPKSTIVEFIKNVSQANPGVVTTTEDHFLTNGAEITITGVPGMTQLNGGSYFIGNLTTNTFALYTDVALTNTVNTTSFSAFPYTTTSATSSSDNSITVANSSPFTANLAVQFTGNTANSNIAANTTYYIKTSGANKLTISATQGGNTIPLATSNVSLEVYGIGGKLTCAVGGSEGTANAGGVNTAVQFNAYNLLEGSANFTFNQDTNLLTVSSSNPSAPGNLLLGGSLTANGNANITSNVIAGNVYANSGTVRGNLLTGTLTTSAQPNITSIGTLSSLNVSGTSNLGAIGNVTITGGSSGNVLTTYGNGVLYWGTGGGGGGGLTGYYLHTQSSVSSTWVINHNLNTQYVSVNPADSTGNSYFGRYDFPTVTYNDANTCTLTWVSPISGTCSVISGGTGGSGYYLHTQAIAGTTWTINHNLNTRYVNFNPVDTTGNSYYGRYDFPTVTYNDGNTLTLTFTSAVAGNCSVIAGGGTTTSGSVTATIITTGANTTPGTIIGNWSLSPGSQLTSTYADLAEYYSADKAYIPGTVLEFGGDKEVTLASEESNKLAGVVSSEPSYVMNGGINAEHPVMIALIGRVPVRVIGHVSKGNMLVSAGKGLAKASILTPKIGTVIGKAITDKFTDGEGVVEVLVGRM